MSFGDSLRKWATSKASEMLTTDGQKREGAAASADATEQQAQSHVGEQLVRAAFPKLGQWADKQEADRARREQAADEAERARIGGLPLVAVQLSLTDWTTAQWSGQLHLDWTVVAPEDPDPDYPSTDPYAARPNVSVELFAQDGARPSLGGHALVHWGFQLPGYTGDGVYDLTAIAREREPAALTYEEWGMDFADSDDSSFYFFVDAGQSTVTVSQGGTRLSMRMVLSGALGGLGVSAELSR